MPYGAFMGLRMAEVLIMGQQVTGRRITGVGAAPFKSLLHKIELAFFFKTVKHLVAELHKRIECHDQFFSVYRSAIRVV